MLSLKLSYILEHTDIDVRKTKMIRHSVKDKGFAWCCANGCFEAYQNTQKKGFFNNVSYILSFVSVGGTSAKFLGCYKTGDVVNIHEAILPKNFNIYLDDDDHCYAEKSEILSDLDGRLIIDWGKSARAWWQWATNDKTVLSIYENPKYSFSGYENIKLMYSELSEIINDPIMYENWHTVLSCVNAIYLITDTTDGKLYVGSACGKDGLLGRWKCYIDTKTGGNKEIVELIRGFPSRYMNFQFSILQVLPKTIIAEDAISIENIYKEKLLTRIFGLNAN